MGGKMGAQKPGSFTAADIFCYKYATSRKGALTSSINYYRAALRYKPQRYDTEKVQVPTLIIWGTEDGALEKEMALMSAEYCEDCEVKYIEGCSHWVQQEEPGQTNAFIREWLERK